MQICDVMTPNPRTVCPSDTLQLAAQAMDDLNVGVLPVCEEGGLLGLLTDRDIVIRSTSAGQDPRIATVADAMSTEPRTVHVDDMDAALQMMEDQQLRRVLVLDDQGQLCGIVTLGDMAAAGTPEVADALEAISTYTGSET